jgi:acetyl esterase
MDSFGEDIFFAWDKFLHPELVTDIHYEDLQIPVSPHSDALTGIIQDSILIRIYNKNKPQESQDHTEQLKPVLVWFHGGGWVVGSAKADHVICAKLALHSNYVVVNVDYRLAPNFPFPIPPKDVYQAIQWVSEHIVEYGGDGNRIIVGGESAGGNLAASTIYQAFTDTEDESPVLKDKIIGSLLVSAPLGGGAFRSSQEDLNNKDSAAHPKNKEFIGLLTPQQGQWFYALYQGNVGWDDNIRKNPLFSPLLVPEEVLANFPPTVIVQAGYDSLIQENMIFRDRLKSYGRSVSWQMYSDTIHWFYGKPIISQHGDESLIQSIRELEKLLGQ